MSRFYRKLGGLLGLFAILMATLAPTISHTLAAGRAHDDLAGMHCDMPSMQHDTPSDEADSDRHSTLSGDMQDCGYCSLLAHLPVMPSVQALFAVTIRAIQQRVAVRFNSVRRIETFNSAQPRAPPFPS